MVVQHEPKHESFAAGIRQPSQPPEIRGANGRRCFHLDADDPALPILEDDIHLVAVLVAELGELEVVFGPTSQLQQFPEDKGLQQRAERRAVGADALRGEPA